ncbi:helix-turn-helix domain-containing protein [Aequorivita capsosiphonis]|uniref:helix-turn-helix domain-containing protein n=1 Tax=Aequorivita capsosiphonis TaxID=487317 RepID=UPI00040A2771|nr:AraC family transcriptional regulator [Aequorivita capsosiphonis]
MKPSANSTSNSNNLFAIENRRFLSLDVEQTQIINTVLNPFAYIEYSLCPLEADNIKVNVSNQEGFYFIYCWQGNLSVRLNDEKQNEIAAFQSSIIYDRAGKGINIEFQKQTSNQFCIISFTRPKLRSPEIENSCYFRITEAFRAALPENTNVFTGKPYLKLLEKINILSRITKENIASELIMQGMIYQILGLKMNQLLEEINNIGLDYGCLNNREMERISAVSDFIRENPSLDYSIDFLCRETGLSPSKLQEGFKKMYDRTVIDFIRNVRLEKSLELIKTTDLNISEIVYSIGLTSRSYFSKIFRKKYKCSPKYFQEQNKSVAATA